MKKINDLTPYTNILPYDSEIFGVYQPLLGWRSKKIKDRIEKGFKLDTGRILSAIYHRFRSDFQVDVSGERRIPQIDRLAPARLPTTATIQSDSYVMDSIIQDLPPLEEYDDGIWEELIEGDRLQRVLDTTVTKRTQSWYELGGRSLGAQPGHRLVADQLSRESTISGYLLYLKDSKQYAKLKDVFYKMDGNLAELLKLLTYKDPLEYIDPHTDIDRAGLSPLGIVHLFRQYFFEFDSFLGTPVSHVWLSPGSTVELIEIHTRKTITEKTFESSFTTIAKAEESVTEKDELSDAVKESNKSETKFGMNATATQSWIGGSASASASISMGTTQTKAREVAHKHMRQQTEKLSTEIRRNYKTTFKTITEVTDTSSKRYLLTNTTPELINYELRRKMRQVGVQVQDIGTYLCWQTYVDDPGKQLGIAKLVHLAKSPDVGAIPPPEAIPMPEIVETELEIDIPFVQTSDGKGDLDEGYKHGKEADTDFNEGDIETIQDDFAGFVAVCDQPGYKFSNLDFDYRGNDVKIRVDDLVENPSGKITFGIHLSYVNFRGQSPIRVVAKIRWEPTETIIAEIETQNKAKIDSFNEQTQAEYRKAFVEAARDRINKASNIQPRKHEDLREEERIVVYRSLIQQMLTRGIPMPDDRTRHVVSELLNTIFDIDKMLYFVAPEWWRPRLHRSHQSLGGLDIPGEAGAAVGAGWVAGAAGAGSPSMYGQLNDALKAGVVTKPYPFTPQEDSQVPGTSVVSWGGVGEGRVDNYYITEESTPAKLGSSLGWLLQLDGDNMRNAFLNAPWVKAVIPIRPGREKAAINWLQRVHVEGTDGLDDQYVASPAELADIPHAGPHVTIRDAINHLAYQVAQKHAASLEVDKHPAEEINDDNKVSATPIDKVYEHGFYPLQGGFRVQEADQFEVFDQWVEILPTDQVVPVEVEYDPKTGRQI